MGKASSGKRITVKKDFPAKDIIPNKNSYPSLWLRVLLMSIIIITGVIVYSVSLNANFIWDDHSIVRSPAVHDFSNVLKKYKDNPVMNEKFLLYISRPVTMLTFVLNYKIHDFNVTGYHAFNTLIHILTALLVYIFVTLTLKTDYFKNSRLSYHRHIIAFFTSLLFVAHPIQTQAVSYISQRFVSLSTFFYLLALVLYIRFRLLNIENNKSLSTSQVLYYSGAILSAILAYKSKEIAYTLPFMCLLCEMLFFKDSLKRRLLMLLPLFITLVVLPITMFLISYYSIIDAGAKYTALRAPGMLQDIPRIHYLFTEMVILIRYLGLFFFPINQSIYHDYTLYKSFFELPVLLSFVLFSASLVVVLRRTIRHPDNVYYRFFAFGILWYLIALSIESSIIPLYPIYEHRMYLPSIGVLFCVVAVIVNLSIHNSSVVHRVPSVVIAILLVVSAIYAFLGYNRNKVFSNDRMLWEDVRAKKSTNIPHSLIMNLGLAYMREGRYEDALREFYNIINITPHKTEVYNAIGVIYLKMQKYDSAIEAYKKVLEINPNTPEALVGIGKAYLNTGKTQEAISSLLEGKKGMYPHYMIYALLGTAYVKNNQSDEALKAFETAVRLKPDFVDGYIQIGTIYEKKRQYDKALKAFSKASTYSPDNPHIKRKITELHEQAVK